MGRFGEFLVDQGQLQPEHLKRAIDMQQLVGGRLGTNLLELGLMQEDRLLEALGQFRHTRTASAAELAEVPTDVFRLVPPQIARRHLVVPIARRGHSLVLAAKDPGDPLVEDELGHLTSCLVRTVIALELRVHEALERYYRLPQPVRLSGLVRRLKSGLSPSAPPKSAPENDPDLAQGGAPASSLRPLSDSPARPPDVQENSAQPRLLPTSKPAAKPVPETPLEPEIRYIDLDADTRARIYSQGPDLRTPQGRLDAAAEELGKISIRDEIGDVLLSYAKPYLRRRLLFIHRKDQIVGWRGEGVSFDQERIRTIEIQASQPSVFLTLLQGTEFWLGSLVPSSSHQLMAEALGDPRPKDCLILPVILRSRVVAFLYGDNAGESVGTAPLSELRRLARKAGVAFEVCILKNKIRTL